MQKCVSTGISLPQELFNKVEQRRGDISRSRFLLRIIEKTLVEGNESDEKNNNNNAGFGDPATGTDRDTTEDVSSPQAENLEIETDNK